MKNRLFFGLVLMITVSLLAGCGGNSSSGPSDYVQITVEGQTYTLSAGLTSSSSYPDSPFDGKCLGNYVNKAGIYIYGSKSPDSQLYGATNNSLMIFSEEEGAGTYSAEVYWANSGVFKENINSADGSVTITQYDAVGGRIKGTFSAKIKADSEDETKAVTVTGSFDVKRYTDGAMEHYLM
jgi:hypothetical protein